MRLSPIILLLLTVLLWATGASAQVGDTTSGTPLPLGDLDSIWPMVFRLALTLAVVLAIIFVTLWVFKRLVGRRWWGSAPTHMVQVLDRVPLAPKRSLDVVAVGERIILLGVSENGINYLTELSAEEKGRLEATPGATPVGFKHTLGEARSRMRDAFRQVRTHLPETASPNTAAVKPS